MADGGVGRGFAGAPREHHRRQRRRERTAQQRRLKRPEVLDGPEAERGPADEAAERLQGVDSPERQVGAAMRTTCRAIGHVGSAVRTACHFAGHRAVRTVDPTDAARQRKRQPDERAGRRHEQQRRQGDFRQRQKLAGADSQPRAGPAEDPQIHARREAEQRQDRDESHVRPRLPGACAREPSAQLRSARDAQQPRAQDDAPGELAAVHQHDGFAQQQRLRHDRLRPPGDDQRAEPPTAAAVAGGRREYGLARRHARAPAPV